MIPVSGVSDPVGMGMCEVAMALMGMYLLDVLMSGDGSGVEIFE